MLVCSRQAEQRVGVQCADNHQLDLKRQLDERHLVLRQSDSSELEFRGKNGVSGLLQFTPTRGASSAATQCGQCKEYRCVVGMLLIMIKCSKARRVKSGTVVNSRSIVMHDLFASCLFSWHCKALARRSYLAIYSELSYLYDTHVHP